MEMEQYILFTNNQQKFAINVSKIDRIIEYVKPKRLPDSSPFFIGVIQHNNSILPIIDLSKRFYDIYSEYNKTTKVIVLIWKGKHIGIVVDDIIGIESFMASQFEDYELDIEISSEYILGFIKSHGDIIVTLDIDKIFNEEQTEELNSISD